MSVSYIRQALAVGLACFASTCHGQPLPTANEDSQRFPEAGQPRKLVTHEIGTHPLKMLSKLLIAFEPATAFQPPNLWTLSKPSSAHLPVIPTALQGLLSRGPFMTTTDDELLEAFDNDDELSMEEEEAFRAGQMEATGEEALEDFEADETTIPAFDEDDLMTATEDELMQSALNRARMIDPTYGKQIEAPDKELLKAFDEDDMLDSTDDELMEAAFKQAQLLDRDDKLMEATDGDLMEAFYEDDLMDGTDDELMEEAFDNAMLTGTTDDKLMEAADEELMETFDKDDMMDPTNDELMEEAFNHALPTGVADNKLMEATDEELMEAFNKDDLMHPIDDELMEETDEELLEAFDNDDMIDATDEEQMEAAFNRVEPMEAFDEEELTEATDEAAEAFRIPNGFEKLGIRQDICEALDAIHVRRPNVVQERTIPSVLGRGNFVIGAQTGSGKTLSYLIPTMQALKDDEEAEVLRAKPKRPRAIVLVPTRELALQVWGVAKSLSHGAKLSARVVHGGVPEAPQKRQLAEGPVDILVATPGRLLQLLDHKVLFLGSVRHVVLDEVDTMFEQGFGPDLERILKITTRDLEKDPKGNPHHDVITHLAVGATHPKSALAMYDKFLHGARRLMVEGSHTVPAKLKQNFLVCRGPDSKPKMLRDLLGAADETGQPRIGRVVVFCISQDSARFLDHDLVEHGYSTANYHGAVPANQRSQNYKSFVRGDSHVLVTTDLAARGLDELDVRHVIHFDFPKTAADYIHRCGRTARNGRKGTSTALVTKWDESLVKAIQDAQSRGEDLISAGARHENRKKHQNMFELRPAVAVKTKAAFPSGKGSRSNSKKKNERMARSAEYRKRLEEERKKLNINGRGRHVRGGPRVTKKLAAALKAKRSSQPKQLKKRMYR